MRYRYLPLSRPLIPPWVLVVVLEGLRLPPPIRAISGGKSQHLSFKIVLLVVLASACLRVISMREYCEEKNV